MVGNWMVVAGGCDRYLEPVHILVEVLDLHRGFAWTLPNLHIPFE